MNYCRSIILVRAALSAAYGQFGMEMQTNNAYLRSWKHLAFAMAVLSILTAHPARSEEAHPGAAAAAVTASRAPVEALAHEAMENSPIVLAVRRHYEAEAKVPRQVSTLPDPEITLQQFTVGGPKPFEGYETSNFFYTGFGVQQEIPWPRKLKLRASEASHAADSAHEAITEARRQAAQAVRENYFELFYLGKRLQLLEQNRRDLSAISQITDRLYRVGKGQQQDVIKSQLQETSTLEELELTRMEIAQRQTSLKEILGRDSDSPNIQIADVAPSAFHSDRAAVTALAARQSPEVEMAMHDRMKSEDALDLARADYVPDFSVGYMYQKTGPGFRDYFMLTLGAKIPLYFWRKQKPAIEQAALEREAARDRVRSSSLAAAAEVERQWLAVATSERIIHLYREGLIPQASAGRGSAMAAYQTGKVDFQTLLSAVIDLLNVNEQYYRAIADHEIAISKITQIVGEEP